MHQSPAGLLEAQLAGPHPQEAGASPTTHISNKFPGGAVAAGPGNIQRPTGYETEKCSG